MDSNSLKEYMEAVYARCCRILRDRESARDALQEVMLKYYDAASKKEIRQPMNYLYRLSTNHCLKLLRKAGREQPTEPDILQLLSPSVESHAEEMSIVERMLEKFDKEDVALLVYRYVDRMTYEEIAVLYGMSDRGMKKRIDRLLKQIRNYLKR